MCSVLEVVVVEVVVEVLVIAVVRCAVENFFNFLLLISFESKVFDTLLYFSVDDSIGSEIVREDY